MKTDITKKTDSYLEAANAISDSLTVFRPECRAISTAYLAISRPLSVISSLSKSIAPVETRLAPAARITRSILADANSGNFFTFSPFNIFRQNI